MRWHRYLIVLVILAILTVPAAVLAENGLPIDAEDVLEVEVDEPGILVDIDTPEDYRQKGP